MPSDAVRPMWSRRPSDALPVRGARTSDATDRLPDGRTLKGRKEGKEGHSPLGIPSVPSEQEGKNKDVLWFWASIAFHPSFARLEVLATGNTMTGLQPGPLRRLLTFDRGRVARTLDGLLDRHRNRPAPIRHPVSGYADGVRRTAPTETLERRGNRQSGGTFSLKTQASLHTSFSRRFPSY